MRRMLPLAIIGLAAAVAPGAVVVQTSHGDSNMVGLDLPIATDDLLAGLIGAEQIGDLGWHPALVAANSPLDQLPAFTDGVGDRGSGLTGLLNDPFFGGDGSDDPVKLVRYDLGGSKNIDELRIYSGNFGGKDGRVFSTTVVLYSYDGIHFFELGYFQSDPSGTTNYVQTWGSTLVRIFDDNGAYILTGVTHLQFNFYAVHRNNDIMHDPFNGVNPYTGLDDGQLSPFTSPLIWEIDALGSAAEVCDNGLDDDGDELVDCDDPDCAGGPACFCHHPFADADGDLDVDLADFGVWQSCFTGFNAGSVPPPPSYCSCFDVLNDNDIDQDDLAAFLNCFSGPDVLAQVGCTG